MTPKDKKTPRTTSYMVLGQLSSTGDTFAWRELGFFPASTANEAKREAAKNNHEEFTTFVAVPQRSWHPSTRNVEQVRKETWS
jgi:hypothetical protein